MKSVAKLKCLVASLFALVALPTVAATPVIMTDQGGKWNNSTRNQYYSQDQGSQLIRLNWAMALKQPNGKPFMADSLQRYGYLPNPQSPVPGLPVGFTVSNANGGLDMGMTCAACHTRQIDVAGKAYRIDGGPAISDFQSFMSGLDTAVNTVLTNPKAFANFAKAVLGDTSSQADQDALRADLAAWYLPYHTIVTGSLPVDNPWGPARLDAISMIFNRLSGLDIGPPPTYIIKENIKLADAPVRYPFLWNAPIQDFTQWPGFSPNGNDFFGLSRNLGEVIGVFATFHPVKDASKLLKIDYTSNNSGNFSGLNKLEDLIDKLGPPKWPWKLNPVLAAQGEAVFNKKDPAQGDKSCNDCHGITKGQFRTPFRETWATPILDVGTDSREVNLLKSTVKTGVLEGAVIFPGGEPLKAVDKASSLLGTAVVGSILQHYLPLPANSIEQTVVSKAESFLAKLKGEAAKIEGDFESKATRFGSIDDLKETLATPAATTTGPYPYESRVMQGIWAAAPYLHNGSVASLADLLKPAAQRQAQFSVGPAYDIKNVGLAKSQTKFKYVLKTTDCSQRDSGNSRCGHEFGTSFSAAEKTALLEYLKKL